METLTKVKPAQKKENSAEHDTTLEKIQQADQSESASGFSANGSSYEHVNLNGSTPNNHTSVKTLEEDNSSFYAWRFEPMTLPDGTTRLKEVRLPPERFLNPQEGDHFMQSNKHHTLSGSIHNKYEIRYDGDDSVGVFSDLKMKWGIAGLDEPAPDLAVVPNLKNPEKHRGTFKVPEEGTKPMFIVEVTSPHYPYDKDKVPLYEQVGVQEYIIVDPHWGSDDELEFFGYHLVNDSYQPMQKDSQGRLYSATTDTYISFETDEGDEIITHIIDGSTGEELFDSKESHRGRLAEKERADSEKERADSEAAQRQAAEERAKKAEEEIAAMLAEIERLKTATKEDDSKDKK